MSAPLVPCHGCARHLRAQETSCPFCGIDRDPIANGVALPPPLERHALTRAALFFATTTTLATAGASIVGCEKQAVDGSSGTAPTTTAVVQPYGVPVIQDRDAAPPPQPSATTSASASTTTTAPSTADAGVRPNVVQPYGVPVMRDAGRK